MSHNTLTETQFLSMVNTIASQHNCRLVNIDTNKRIINITGPTKSERDCAIQLETILGKYTTI
jgi:hypothetical protein